MGTIFHIFGCVPQKLVPQNATFIENLQKPWENENVLTKIEVKIGCLLQNMPIIYPRIAKISSAIISSCKTKFSYEVRLT